MLIRLNMQVELNPKKLRKTVIEMAYQGQSVHIACAFSMIEMFTALFSSDSFRYNIKDPDDKDSDRLILSKGHGVMALYAVQRELGWISDEDVKNYFKDGSKLHGLCEPETPGINFAGGSLGHGVPVAVGSAFGLKLKNKTQRVYCLCGDGELNEGAVWEAVMFASHHKLSNFVLLVDANGYQAMGKAQEIIGLEPMAERFSSFGFETIEIDGHNLSESKKALARVDSQRSKPLVIIARTIKGYGLSFMAGQNDWHYQRLNETSYQRALKELES